MWERCSHAFPLKNTVATTNCMFLLHYKNNLRLAEDIGLLTESETELQEITTQIDETSRKFGIMINAEKAKTMIIEKRKSLNIL